MVSLGAQRGGHVAATRIQFTGFVMTMQKTQVFVDREAAADHAAQLLEPLLLLRCQCRRRWRGRSRCGLSTCGLGCIGPSFTSGGSCCQHGQITTCRMVWMMVVLGGDKHGTSYVSVLSVGARAAAEQRTRRSGIVGSRSPPAGRLLAALPWLVPACDRHTHKGATWYQQCTRASQRTRRLRPRCR